MRKFNKKTFRFIGILVAPYIALLLNFVITDPFRLQTYPPYVDGYHHINRGVVTTTGYLKSTAVNTIILGNSRSLSLRCSDLLQYCDSCGNCFHFDASADNLFGFRQKARLISQHQRKLDHVFIFLDDQSVEPNRIHESKFPFVRHPVYGEKNWPEFYLIFIKQYLNLKYQFAHISKNASLSVWVQPFNNKEFQFDESTADLTFPAEMRIKQDSISYYRNDPDFSLTYSDTYYDLSSLQLDVLEESIQLLQSLNAECTIIFQPRYKRTHPSKAALDSIKTRMPCVEVFDASNINEVIDNNGFWYESSHFRPNAGKLIFEAIYTEEVLPHALQLP